MRGGRHEPDAIVADDRILSAACRSVTPALPPPDGRPLTAGFALPSHRSTRVGAVRSGRPNRSGRIAPAGEALACFQPSQRYFLDDEGRCGEDDLPRRNLVSALVAFENSDSAAGLSAGKGRTTGEPPATPSRG